MHAISANLIACEPSIEGIVAGLIGRRTARATTSGAAAARGAVERRLGRVARRRAARSRGVVAASLSAAPRQPAPSPALTPPPGNPRFALFDSLRAFAVIAIVLFHVASLTNALARPVTGQVEAVLGSLGPPLFFAISGFLLYRPFVVARAGGRPFPSVARYGRRRVLRIVPAYWAALTVLAIFPGIVGVFTGDWWRYYLFLQIYSERTVGGGLPVAWTLCVEVAFYVTLPLWALLLRRATRGRPETAAWRADLGALALLAAAGTAVQVAAARQAVSYLAAESLAGQCIWLALGMAFAVLSVRAERSRDEWAWVAAVRRHPGWCWLGAAAALAALTALVPAQSILAIAAQLAAKRSAGTTVLTIALSAVLLALLVAPAVFGQHDGGLPRRVLAWGPLAWIGLVSYGMYLWHLPLLELIGEHADPSHFSATGLDLLGHLHHARTPVLFAAALAASAAAAALSYRFVELPFLRRKEG